MNSQIQPSQKYLDTLLQYYEEEVQGVAEFYALAEHFSERDKTILLAEVEQVAADAVKPLLKKYGLKPRDEAILHDEGRSYVTEYLSWDWNQYMDYVVNRFPGYLEEFYGLENMAPAEDLPALQKLTEHEVVVIEFAEKELAGDPDVRALLETP